MFVVCFQFLIPCVHFHFCVLLEINLSQQLNILHRSKFFGGSLACRILPLPNLLWFANISFSHLTGVKDFCYARDGSNADLLLSVQYFSLCILAEQRLHEWPDLCLRECCSQKFEMSGLPCMLDSLSLLQLQPKSHPSFLIVFSNCIFRCLIKQDFQTVVRRASMRTKKKLQNKKRERETEVLIIILN